MIGTFANTGAIIAGSLIGVLIHSRLPQKMVDIIFQGLGLCTLIIGISMALRADEMLLVVISIASGAIIGQWMDLDRYLHRFSGYLQKISHKDTNTNSRFTEGFVTASMLFCIGSMSILGAIEDGMGETPNLLYTKSIMDGISSVAFASTFGICILFTSVPVLIYQGGLTLFAAFIMQFMSESMMADMTSVGGILLMGLGINILKIKDICVTNMLPSLIIVVVLSWLF